MVATRSVCQSLALSATYVINTRYIQRILGQHSASQHSTVHSTDHKNGYHFIHYTKHNKSHANTAAALHDTLQQHTVQCPVKDVQHSINQNSTTLRYITFADTVITV
jgi:hypothetical protein